METAHVYGQSMNMREREKLEAACSWNFREPSHHTTQTCCTCYTVCNLSVNLKYDPLCSSSSGQNGFKIMPQVGLLGISQELIISRCLLGLTLMKNSATLPQLSKDIFFILCVTITGKTYKTWLGITQADVCRWTSTVWLPGPLCISHI